MAVGFDLPVTNTWEQHMPKKAFGRHYTLFFEILETREAPTVAPWQLETFQSPPPVSAKRLVAMERRQQ